MNIALAWGTQQLDLDVPTENLIAVRRAAPTQPVTDPAEAVRVALEQPFAFPPLRRALTPDDHVAVVVDESIPSLPTLLPPLFEHLRSAHVQMDAVTLVCLPPSSGQPWIDDLPDDFQDVQVEVHQPADRKKLAYLATTKQGRRIYLNRTTVDADQAVLLTRRRYDPLLGYGGAEGLVFPGLCDQAALDEVASNLSLDFPGVRPSAFKSEAAEVAWLLGVPFLVQVIEGRDGAIQQIVGGSLESSAEGERLLDQQWRVEVAEPADVVVATLTGNPDQHRFADLARAFAAAARVVRPGGSIVLFTDARPELGPSAALLRQHDDAHAALAALLRDRPADLDAGFLWASAAVQAHLYLLSKLDLDVAEELFTTPLQHAGQVQRLLSRRCLFLPDAHHTMAVVRP